MKKDANWLCFLFFIPFILACHSNRLVRLVVLPDTQSYMVADPGIFRQQVEWIAGQSARIDFVLHEGDITQNNNDEEWKTAAEILAKLDDLVPYSFVPGNHDMGSAPGKFADNRNTDLMNKYLPYAKFRQFPYFGGAFEEGKMDNTWSQFSKGGQEWLVMSLEFGPRDEVLEWASDVIGRHPDHLVIINTHAYLYSDNTHHGSDPSHKHVVRNYGIGKVPAGPEYANEGIEVWEKLVHKHANILFVFNGHVTAGSGVGHLVSEGDHGNQVYQMLANYQKEIADSEGGTTGNLRIVTIDKKSGSVQVKTYSPTRGKFRRDDGHEISFENIRFRR